MRLKATSFSSPRLQSCLESRLTAAGRTLQTVSAELEKLIADSVTTAPSSFAPLVTYFLLNLRLICFTVIVQLVAGSQLWLALRFSGTVSHGAPPDISYAFATAAPPSPTAK
jgi:hypothetical protein